MPELKIVSGCAHAFVVPAENPHSAWLPENAKVQAKQNGAIASSHERRLATVMNYQAWDKTVLMETEACFRTSREAIRRMKELLRRTNNRIQQSKDLLRKNPLVALDCNQRPRKRA